MGWVVYFSLGVNFIFIFNAINLGWGSHLDLALQQFTLCLSYKELNEESRSMGLTPSRWN